MSSQSCSSCNKALSDECIIAKGARFHPNCFVCCQCNGALAGQQYVVQNGSFMHIRCYEKKENLFCSECKNVITESYVNFHDRKIHHECFLCAICKDFLMGSYHEKDDLPLCGKCYKKSQDKKLMSFFHGKDQKYENAKNSALGWAAEEAKHDGFDVEYPEEDWAIAFSDGRLISSIVNSMKPGTFNINKLNSDPVKAIQEAMDILHEDFGIAPTMTAADMHIIPHPKLVQMAIVGYLTEVKLKQQQYGENRRTSNTWELIDTVDNRGNHESGQSSSGKPPPVKGDHNMLSAQKRRLRSPKSS